MKEIFDKIKDREWDWFGWEDYQIKGAECYENKLVYLDYESTVLVSLADLLANKSWTDACGLNQRKVMTAFLYLREEGHDAAIEYIKQTML